MFCCKRAIGALLSYRPPVRIELLLLANGRFSPQVTPCCVALVSTFLDEDSLKNSDRFANGSQNSSRGFLKLSPEPFSHLFFCSRATIHAFFCSLEGGGYHKRHRPSFAALSFCVISHFFFCVAEIFAEDLRSYLAHARPMVPFHRSRSNVNLSRRSVCYRCLTCAIMTW